MHCNRLSLFIRVYHYTPLCIPLIRRWVVEAFFFAGIHFRAWRSRYAGARANGSRKINDHLKKKIKKTNNDNEKNTGNIINSDPIKWNYIVGMFAALSFSRSLEWHVIIVSGLRRDSNRNYWLLFNTVTWIKS